MINPQSWAGRGWSYPINGFHLPVNPQSLCPSWTIQQIPTILFHRGPFFFHVIALIRGPWNLQIILTRSILSFLTSCCLEVQFLLVFSCTDLFINLTIRPLGPIILDSLLLGFTSPDSSPPLNRAHKSSRSPPSSQSEFVSLSASW